MLILTENKHAALSQIQIYYKTGKIPIIVNFLIFASCLTCIKTDF